MTLYGGKHLHAMNSGMKNVMVFAKVTCFDNDCPKSNYIAFYILR